MQAKRIGLWICCLLMGNFSCQDKISKWEEVLSPDGTAPSPRHECSFVQVDEKFYLLGGRGKKPIDIFDPKTQKWTQGAVPPMEIHHFQAVHYNGYILVVGAMTGEYPYEQPISNILIYETAADRWQLGDIIPEERRRGAGGTVIWKDAIYWVGGIKNGHMNGHLAYLDRYDFKTRTWSILPSAPQARDHFQAIVLNDKLYLVGGRRTSGPYGVFENVIEEVEYYDFAQENWQTAETKLPYPRAGCAVVAIGNEIWVAGGERPQDNFASSRVDVYSTVNNSWTSTDPLLRGRHGTGMVVHDGLIYLAAGSYKKGDRPELGDLISINP